MLGAFVPLIQQLLAAAIVTGSAGVAVSDPQVAASVIDAQVAVAVDSPSRDVDARSLATSVAVERAWPYLAATSATSDVTVVERARGAAIAQPPVRAAQVSTAVALVGIASPPRRAADVADVEAAFAVAHSTRAASITTGARAASVTTLTRSVTPMAYTITRGDSLPLFEATLTAGGVAQNLAGASVQLLALSPTRAAWTHGMTVISAAAGTVRCTFTEAETEALEIGTHRAFIRVTFGDGSTLTFPEGDVGTELTVARGPA